MRTDFWVRRVMRRASIFAIFASMLLRYAREEPQSVRTWASLRNVKRARRRELARVRARNRETIQLTNDLFGLVSRGVA